MAYNTPYRSNRAVVKAPAMTVKQRLNALSPERKQAFRAYVAGVSAKPKPAPAAPAGGATFVLPGSAEAEFAAQRANVNSDYMEQTALNQYKMRNAEIARGREVEDQRQTYIDARSGFDNPYIQRGIMSSGIYGRDLGRLVSAREQEMSRGKEDYARQRAAINLDRAAIERRRTLALANLKMKHQAVLNDAAGRII